jgi:NDP-sugar pyrophosphorylase family protein
MNVLILCAGYGTRLAPLTDVCPKPLVPLVDQPMLGHHLDAVAGLDARHTCVNTHHLAEAVADFATADGRVDVICHEPEILGTGGPLRRLHQDGVTGDLLVANADIYHTVDLVDFVRRAEASSAPFVLLCIDQPAVNTVQLNADMRVVGVDKVFGDGSQAVRRLTYSGIAWYSGEAVAEIGADHFSVVRFWADAAEAGMIGQAIETTKTWLDIGTPAGLHAATYHRLSVLGRDSWGDPPGGVAATRSVFYGSADSADSASVHSCIVLNGADIPAGTTQNSILGRRFQWQL